MASINQFLKQLSTGDQIHDYQHASRIFIDDNYRLSPKYGFLFHVAFDLNSEITRVPRDTMLEMGMVVKTAALPKFTVENKTFNAYNRVNVVQNKIKYDPLTITFHDDSADIIRDFWYDYYSYYYRDSDYQPAVYTSAHKYDQRQQQAWGYQPRQYPASAPGTQQYIRAIRIYSLHQKRFSEYTLLNPVITSFQHGEHQNGNNELMQHSMTIQYEAVKYAFGYVSKNTVSGFADLHYDHTPSPLTPAGGGTNSILGPGGLLNSIDEVTNDLADGNFLSAALKGIRGIQNAKNMDLKAVAGAELSAIGMGILRGQNPLGQVNIPTISNLAGGMSGLAGTAGQYGNALLAGLFAPSGANSPVKYSGKDTAAATRSMVPTGAISSNGESIDQSSATPGNYDPQFPGTNPNGVQTFDDGSSIQTFDDGTQLTIDADGNVVSSSQVVDPTPAQDPVVPVYSEESSVNMSNYNDFGVDLSSDQSTPVDTSSDTTSPGSDEWW
jgi:hypothetical protein